MTCPVHALGAYLDKCPVGHKLFEGITPAKATRALRVLLKLAQVKDFATYRLHDLRRGHALDLQLSGAPLAEILAAGEWRSPAFMKYLNMHQLKEDLVVPAHLEESEPEHEW